MSDNSALATDSLDRPKNQSTLSVILAPELDPLFWRPDLLDNTSAWFGHTPFAHWLIHELRPRVLVELGTHAGVSYSSFCFAVLKAQTGTRCFAVDTWKGDPHAGKYPERIFEDLHEFNLQNHGHFSTLYRCTFDEALERFEDSSIDILHIDGFHTYEAVRHDFISWLPKLSNKAVVLFHDTNEHKEEFGVWRFWSEIRKKYPSFEFLHGHGLGVLGVGEALPKAIVELCALNNEKESNTIRRRFQLLGERWMIEARARREKKDSAEKQRKDNEEHVRILNEANASALKRTQALEKSLNEATAKLLALKAETQTQLSLKNKEVAQATDRASALHRRASKLEREKIAILNSVSWRLTAPLRLVFGNMRRKRVYRAISASYLFDKKWYLEKYPDVNAAFTDPIQHYLQSGANEGRNPSAGFDTAYYVAQYPDVAAANINPLYHYIKYGHKELRFTKPNQYFDLEASRLWIEALRDHPASAAIRATKPLVSIILPTKDRATLLPTAIDSVLAQTYGNWELLIIDDGSVDETATLVKSEYGDNRIKLIQTTGVGVCEARNVGLNNTKGQFIAYLDSDNSWTPIFLEMMLNEMERSSSDCAYAVLQVMDEPVNDMPAKPWYRMVSFDYEQLKNSNYIDLNIFIHRKSLYLELGGFDNQLKRMVDWDLILRYTRDHPISFANFIGANYDNSHAPDRITHKEALGWNDVVRNKHLIDWQYLRDTVNSRDRSLISIVILHRGDPQQTEACLKSLFSQEAGASFEVILVGHYKNGRSNEEFAGWADLYPSIKLIHTAEQYSVALARNLGFAATQGAYVVFLAKNIIVTSNWLRPLVAALEDSKVIASTSKILYSNETTKATGIVFSKQSSIGYALYEGEHASFGPVQKARNFAAVLVACTAFRVDSFIRVNGFDPIYSGYEQDIDLCLRTGQGESVFRYVPESIVRYHLSDKIDIEPNIESDRKTFENRWSQRIIADDLNYYTEDNIEVRCYISTDPKWFDSRHRSWRPEAIRAFNDQSTQKLTFTEKCTNHRKIGYVLWDWPALSQTFVMNELRSLLSRGIDVKVYFKVEAENPAQLDFNVDSYRINEVDDLVELLTTHRRTVLHSPFAYPATTLLTWPAAEKLKIPFTFMPGGVDISHYENMKRNRIMDVSHSTQCIGIVTLGTYHKNFLIEQGVSSNKIIMERQAVGLPVFTPKYEVNKHPVIATIGRFIEKKGFSVLIEAAANLPKYNFKLYGYGPLATELEKLKLKLNATNVSFEGDLKDTTELHLAYQNADIFTLPCIQATNGDLDGLPTVLLEAMASGTPVVSTRIANIPDLITDNITGFLCRPNDSSDLAEKLEQALSLTPDRRHQLINLAQKYAANYASTEKTVTTLLHVWQRRSIDIVLVTYDTADYSDLAETIEIIKRIYKYTTTSFNIYIIDNNSQESFKTAIKDKFSSHLNFHFIELEANKLCGPASNIGISLGSAEYIIYLCSKEGYVLQHGWEGRMLEEMDRNPSAAIGGYLVQLPKYPTGRKLQSYPSFGQWRNTEFAKEHPERRFAHVQGGLYILRRSAYDDVGGFSENVPQDGTDVEYSYYLESCGKSLLNIPGIVGISSKTLPALLPRITERTLAVHPAGLQSISLLEDIVNRAKKHCPICGWIGDGFDISDDDLGTCPSCNSTAFCRSVFMALSHAGVLQTRPNVVTFARNNSLDKALMPICPNRQFHHTKDARHLIQLVNSETSLINSSGLIIIDRFECYEQDLDQIISAFASFLKNKGCLVIGGYSGEYLDSLIRILGQHEIAIEDPCLIQFTSNSNGVDPMPIYLLGNHECLISDFTKTAA